MSEVKVNKISPRSGTGVQLGDSGDTITIPAGATFDASAGTITLADGSVTTVKIADGAVSLAKLSATGTKDNTTFLRGDNTFQVVSTDLVDDTSPQLGGNLDVNGNDIVSTSNADIDVLPNGTGKTNFGGTTGIVLPSGTTAQRVNTTGLIRFNSTTGLAEYYDGTSFKSIDSPPSSASINPTSLGESTLGSNQTIVITGSNYASSLTVKIIGNDGSEINPASTTRNSSTQITITTPTSGITNANEPYSFTVTNASGLSSTISDALSINATPVFSTPAGSLGTLADTGRASSNLTPIAFTDSDNSATVSVTSGSLPGGITLNTNGSFSGTANAVSSDTTSTFTVTATDGSESATRQYTITVNAPINISYVVVAGGGGGGSQVGGGGGAGGMLTGSVVKPSSGTINVSIGGGGGGGSSGGQGSQGSGSSISSAISVSTTGGGYGGGYNAYSPGGSGGSGGGGGNFGTVVGGSGTAGQGNRGGASYGGYNGGGGGGRTAVGNDGTSGGVGGNGGAGLATSITGSSITLAGGGGGCRENSGNSVGGSGGGGNGGSNSPATNPTDGSANTGGGGGGSRDHPTPYAGNQGGSGVVYLSIPTSVYSGTTSGSPTVTTSGGNTIMKFTGNGSYTI